MTQETMFLNDIKKNCGYYVGEYEENSLPVNYLLQSDGLYKVANTNFGRICYRLFNKQMTGLPHVMDEGIEISLPKIPEHFFWDLVSLFREVNKSMTCEIRANIYWDKTKEKYFIYIPEQNVSARHTTETNQEEINKMAENNILVVESHSHHTMRGGFSSIDDGAQQDLNALHLVIGNIDKEFPSFEFRFTDGEYKVNVDILNAFDFPNMIKPNNKIEWKHKLNKPRKKETTVRRTNHHAILFDDSMDLNETMYMDEKYGFSL